MHSNEQTPQYSVNSNLFDIEVQKGDVNHRKTSMLKDLFRSLRQSSSKNVMDIIHASIRPDPHRHYNACMEVKRDLLHIFRESFPMVLIDVFGSTITGTAMKGKSNDQEFQT